MSLVNVLSASLAITIGVGVTAALIAWRERDEPGAIPLVWMFVGQCLWTTFSLFELQAATFSRKILWSELVWVGAVIIPVAWLLFAMEYTGRDQYLRPRYIAILSVVPSITIVLALTSQSHDLLYTSTEVLEYQGQEFLNRTIGPWGWVVAGYTYLLGVLGSIPLFNLIRSETTIFRGQSGALLLGTLAPWVSNILYLGGIISIPAIDPTPIAFLVSGLAYLGAVTRFGLFSTTPSVSQHARRLFIDLLHEGAIVVDNHDFVVDINDSATQILDVDREEILGRPAPDIIPEYDTFKHETAGAERQTVHFDHIDRQYDITRTKITDSRDRPVGTIFTLHDISDHIRNQQRHRVLNRLFRHNIRTETNLIVSHAELLEDGDGMGDPSSVKESALQVEETAQKAREIIELFEQSSQPTSRVELSRLLENCVKSVAERYPTTEVEMGTLPSDVYVDDVLETVFLNVLDNAAAHNDQGDSQAWVTVDEDEQMVTIEVADNGPGIDDYEQSVIERGTEDSLQHGSGLGLWLIKWGTDLAGGEVAFRDNYPSGTVVSITVPKFSSGTADSTNALTRTHETD